MLEKSAPPPREGRGPGGGAGCWMRDTGLEMMEGRLLPASAETWQIFYKTVGKPYNIRLETVQIPFMNGY